MMARVVKLSCSHLVPMWLLWSPSICGVVENIMTCVLFLLLLLSLPRVSYLSLSQQSPAGIALISTPLGLRCLPGYLIGLMARL